MINTELWEDEVFNFKTRLHITRLKITNNRLESNVSRDRETKSYGKLSPHINTHTLLITQVHINPITKRERFVFIFINLFLVNDLDLLVFM